MSTLVLLCHGQSRWDLEDRFTGWCDTNLTKQGADQALAAGKALLAHNVVPDVVHTSLQTPAIKTANLTLREMDRLWIPVRRHWRLNERHYGSLTGQNRAAVVERYGAERVHLWRRSYDTPPPEAPANHPDNPATDPRYASVPPDLFPATESLRHVVGRTLPYWFDAIVPDLRAHETVLISSHRNTVRALVKHLSHISDSDIANLDIASGVPLIYDIDSTGRRSADTPVEDRYLR